MWVGRVALLCAARSNFQAARDYCARALAIRRQALLPGHPDLVATEQQSNQLAQGDESGILSLMQRESVETAHPLG